jgi:hypothetical protein
VQFSTGILRALRGACTGDARECNEMQPDAKECNKLVRKRFDMVFAINSAEQGMR